MKPPPFKYVRPSSLDEALAVLHEMADEDAKPIAGGQSLTPMLNLRLARPGVLVDINDIGLDQIEVSDAEVRTGALVRHFRWLTEATVATELPLLKLVAPYIGHPAIRNRGTLGGSLSHADPTAELAVAALTVGARLDVASTAATREIPADELFAGPYVSTLEPDELIVGVRWPRAASGERFGFSEIAEREGDFAMAAAAARLRVEEGEVADARLVVAGATATPLQVDEVAMALVGAAADGDLGRLAAEACPQLDGRSDTHASGAFRAELVRATVEAAVAEAAQERAAV